MKTHIPRRSQKIVPLIVEYKAEVQKLYKDSFVQLILYGSYARGTPKEFSDIDLLVVTNYNDYNLHDNKELSELNYNFFTQYEIFFNVIVTTFLRFTTYKIPLYLNIQKEGIIV